MPRFVVFSRLVCICLLYAVFAPAGLASNTVTILVTDRVSGEQVPVRMELMDEHGNAVTAQNALPVTGNCVLPPMPGWLSSKPDRTIYNPYTDTVQFYVDGAAEFSLARGRYDLRVFKGLEYRVLDTQFDIGDEPADFEFQIERWTDSSAKGWFSADDHLHIPRQTSAQNDPVALWMAAEGLDVANLLAMGTVDHFDVAPQYAFGDDGAYRNQSTLLLSGQEHPRTHVFGHTITLGAASPVDRRGDYVIYSNAFVDAEKSGGVSGFAHWGIGAAKDGLAIFAPTGLVKFLEVLQFEFAHYEVWYQLLNLGLKIAPTGGTDFPCGGPTIPGRERFYVYIDGQLTRRSFVQSIREGRTIVTNGPLLTFRVNDAEIGEELAVDSDDVLIVEGTVRYDPERDRIDSVELVRNGLPASVDVVPIEEGYLEFRTKTSVDDAAWFAMRVSGTKIDEAENFNSMPPSVRTMFEKHTAGAGGPEFWSYLDRRRSRVSAAHTAPIYVRVEDSVLHESGEQAIDWLRRLEDLEALLSEEKIDENEIWDWLPYSDGVSVEHLRSNREALMEAIAHAKRFYYGLTQSDDG
jgi:hypothetical protein